MMWIVIVYFLFLLVGFRLRYGLKKEKCEDYGNLFPYFFVFNLYFVSCFCVIYYKEYRNISLFVAENKVLLNEKIEKEYKWNAIKKEREALENTSRELDHTLDELNRNKNALNKEIVDLKETYQTLYNQLQNTILYQIKNFPTFDQRENYPNGCEAISLYLLLKYHEINVEPDDIVARLRKGDSTYTLNGVKYGADPEIEFVGDPKSKSGYGVFEDPIIEVANQFKDGIQKATGKTLDEVLEIVKSGKPVQVWATSYQKTPIKCNTWISTSDSSKKNITWYCNFHSLVIIGSTQSKVLVSDPLTGTIVYYDKKPFEYAYEFYGRRAIYYE